MESYSERHPIPTTQKYQSEQRARQDEVPSEHEESAQPTPSSKAPSLNNTDEKSQLMNRIAGPKIKPTDKVKQRKSGLTRSVRDPTTGMNVIIKDAEFKGTAFDIGLVKIPLLKFSDFPQGEELSPEIEAGEPALHAADTAIPQHTSPAVAKPRNISMQPFLPSRPVSLGPLLRLLDALQLGLALAFGLMWLCFAFPVGRWWLPFSWPWFSWMFRSILIGGTGAAAVTGVSLVQRQLDKEIERVRADMHRERGERFAPPTPESVEWLNAFTRTIWGLVNPEMFVPIADMVEGEQHHLHLTRCIDYSTHVYRYHAGDQCSLTFIYRD
jgi:hypothetical protein